MISIRDICFIARVDSSLSVGKRHSIVSVLVVILFKMEVNV